MDDPAGHPAFVAVRASFPALLSQAVAFVLPLDAPSKPSEDWVKSHLLAGERGAAELQPLEESLPPVRVAGGKLQVATKTVPIRLEEHFYADQVALAILVTDGASLWDAGTSSSASPSTGGSGPAAGGTSPRPSSGDAELLMTEEEAREALGATSVRAVIAAAAELQRTTPSATALSRFVSTLITRLKLKSSHSSHVSVLLLASLYPVWFPQLSMQSMSGDQRMQELLAVATGIQLADMAWDEPESEVRWEGGIEEAAGRLQSTEGGRTPHDRLRALHAAALALTAHSSKHSLRLTPERLLLLCTVALARAQLPHWHSTVAYITSLHPLASSLQSSGPGYHLATFQAAAEHLRAEDGFRTLLAAKRTRSVRSSLLPSQPTQRKGTAAKPAPVVPVVYQEPPRIISLDDDQDYGDFLSNLRSNG